jgi:hypothetical protein
MPAASFWSWDYCRLKLPEIWQAIADYSWPGAPTVTKTIPELLIEYFNNRNIPLILSLYDDNAVFVTSKQTIQGKNSLNGWYSGLLTTLYPNATFSLDNYSGTDITKKLTWRIINADKTALSVEDTIGLQEGKILYHYSSLQN